MGIIKKYKIIYERNIIISNLIFKANRGEKILSLLNSSRRKSCFVMFRVMPPLSKFGRRKFWIHLKQNSCSKYIFLPSVIACSATSNGYGQGWDSIQKALPNPGSVFESEASIQTWLSAGSVFHHPSVWEGSNSIARLKSRLCRSPTFCFRNCNLDPEWGHSDLKYRFWPISGGGKKYCILLRRQHEYITYPKRWFYITHSVKNYARV